MKLGHQNARVVELSENAFMIAGCMLARRYVCS